MKSLLKSSLFLLSSLFILASSCAPSQREPEALPGEFHIVRKNFPDGKIDGYSLYLPKSYTQNTNKHAVLIFLHGGAGVGGSLARVNQQPLPKLIMKAANGTGERDAFLRDSFLVVCPHLTFGSSAERQFYQQEETMRQIIDEVLANYQADPSRVYLTGLSRGGHGSWGLASKMRDVWAAVVPIAGTLFGYIDEQELKDLPMWVIHNTGDQTVSYRSTARTVDEMESLYGLSFLRLSTMELQDSSDLEQDKIFTSFQREGHDAWTEAYESPVLYRWLLKKRKNR
jgi:predicted peptidase